MSNVNSWQSTILITLLALGLATPFFALLWRTLIAPSAMAKMETRQDRMRETLDAQQDEINELRDAMTADREELASMKVVMAEWRAGMRLVFQQLQAAGIVPVWQPREDDPPAVRGRASRKLESALAGRIARQFNVTEIDNLAFDMGIMRDELSGDTREDRARQLVAMAWRRDFSSALVARVNELRGKE